MTREEQEERRALGDDLRGTWWEELSPAALGRLIGLRDDLLWRERRTLPDRGWAEPRRGGDGRLTICRSRWPSGFARRYGYEPVTHGLRADGKTLCGKPVTDMWERWEAKDTEMTCALCRRVTGINQEIKAALEAAGKGKGAGDGRDGGGDPGVRRGVGSGDGGDTGGAVGTAAAMKAAGEGAGQ